MSPTCNDSLQARTGLTSPVRRSTAIAAAVAAALGVIGAPAVMAQTPTAASGSSSQSTASPQDPDNHTEAGSRGLPLKPILQAGPVSLSFGGFSELAGIYRNRQEAADVGSNYSSGIPLPNNNQYYLSEFRESARQSRFSMLAQGAPYAGASAEMYMETDFLGAAPTANSVESNSYNLRMRHFYGRFISDSGFYLLAGQTWSFLTLEQKGMNPRDEDIPLTIDAQYVVGFNWTRNPQVRLVKKLGDKSAVGISFESPQASVYNGPNKLLNSTVFNLPGGLPGSLYAPNNTYSIDPAPDVVVKAETDPGYGHYEIFGLGRWFRSRFADQNNTVFGGSVGAGMILPIVPKKLNFQASGLVGKGNGRYGSAQLADVAIEPSGALSPISEYQVLLGLTYLPSDDFTAYLYAGREQAKSNAFTAVVGGQTLGYGYGSPLYSNAGCDLQSSNLPCVANTQSSSELTGGFWWKYYSGVLGNLQLGFQAEYIDRKLFEGIGGAPSTNIFIGMVSFRYYPFQQ